MVNYTVDELNDDLVEAIKDLNSNDSGQSLILSVRHLCPFRALSVRFDFSAV